jgi:hypothetical protein
MEDMMNNKTRTSLVVLITLMVLLAAAVPAHAEKQANFSVEYEVGPVDYDHFYADGTYDIIYNEDPYGAGTAVFHWVARFSGAKQGMLILEDDDLVSSMAIRTLISWREAGGGCTKGHFDIQSTHNSGEYNLYGTGIMSLCVEERPDGDYFVGTLVGWAEESHPH